MRILFTLLCIVSFTFAAADSSKTYTDESGRLIHVGALETFRYWANEDPPSDFTVLNGQYWKSGHFTKEYIMYMELTVPTDMAKYFCEDNNLKQTKTDLKTPDGSPKWFNPPKGYEVWLGTQGSKYFINPKTGHMFMYEVQL